MINTINSNIYIQKQGQYKRKFYPHLSQYLNYMGASEEKLSVARTKGANLSSWRNIQGDTLVGNILQLSFNELSSSYDGQYSTYFLSLYKRITYRIFGFWCNICTIYLLGQLVGKLLIEVKND